MFQRMPRCAELTSPTLAMAHIVAQRRVMPAVPTRANQQE
ncbi:Unknown protein sequence [Pseudomonas syringae pv. maculicola]|nr:Unknown protein sequence [Pseudomonas syringae pv. maculicola]